MRTTETAAVAAAPADVFPLVADLSAYPAWMPLVHAATSLGDDADGAPAWEVEIRARIGPFARSKRLRMQRTELVPDRLVVFERAEIDGRDHASWVLRVELEAGAHDPDDATLHEATGESVTGENATGDGATTVVTMHLAYDGSLWTGGALARVFDDQVRRGRDGLVAAVVERSA